MRIAEKGATMQGTRGAASSALYALLVALVAAGPAAAGAGTAEGPFFGQTVVRGAGDGRVLVAVDATNLGHAPDGLVDVVFLLRTGSTEPLRFRFDTANVVADETGLAVTDPRGRTAVLFTLKGRGEPCPDVSAKLGSRDRQLQGFDVVRLDGTEFIRHSAPFAFRLGEVTLARFEAELERLAAADNKPPEEGVVPTPTSGCLCDAGGKGASSCSITAGTRSCSTNCTDGSSACCSYGIGGSPKCECKICS